MTFQKQNSRLAYGKATQCKTKPSETRRIHYVRKLHTELYFMLRRTLGNAEIIWFSFKFRQCLRKCQNSKERENFPAFEITLHLLCQKSLAEISVYGCVLRLPCIDGNTCMLLTLNHSLLYMAWIKPHKVPFKCTAARDEVWDLLLYLFRVIYLSLTCMCEWVCVCVCPQRRQDSSPLPQSSSFTFSTEACHKSPVQRVMGPALENSLATPSPSVSHNPTHTTVPYIQYMQAHIVYTPQRMLKKRLDLCQNVYARTGIANKNLSRRHLKIYSSSAFLAL